MIKTESTSLIIEQITLPETVGLASLFAHVEQQPWALLLDSAERVDHARYDIMLWEPLYTVEAKNGIAKVCNAQGDEVYRSTLESPLDIVDHIQRQLFAKLEVPSQYAALYQQLPFVLGSAGFCSYDLGRYLEVLPTHTKDEYYCPDMAVGLYGQALIFDNHEQAIYNCRLSNIPPAPIDKWLSAANSRKSFKLTSAWQANLSKHEYIEALEKINDYIKAGDCYQINMAQRFLATYQGSEWAAYLALTKANQAPFSAYMRVPNSTIMSISPERFLSVSGGVVETKPIKGTRPRSIDPKQDKALAEDLFNADKDRAENLMIVDLLRNDLSKHCQPNSVDVPSLFAVESYPAVHHLVSTVVGRLKPESSPLKLFAGAFPGGSITGAPKIRAMEIIDELEPNRRAVYCGSMFYFGLKQDMDSSICIRTILAEQNHLYCWAGGGIVLDSQAQAEYQETLDKVAKILPVLEGFVE